MNDAKEVIGRLAEPEVEEPESTIWGALDQWANELSGWQNALLFAAVRGNDIEDDAIVEAYTRFKIDNGLEDAELERKFSADTQKSITGRRHEAQAEPLTLLAAEGLENVNALPSDASLPFGPNLTVVYGGNGAGKSGYFRFLAAACFSRAKPTLLPNVYEDNQTGATGYLSVQLGGKPSEKVRVSPGTEDPQLKRVSVFDSAVANAHLTDSNPLGFEPAGFDVFEKMKVATEALLGLLNADIEKRPKDNPFKEMFPDPSPIQGIVSRLSADTDISALKHFAEFTKDDELRITELDQSIAELTTKSPANMIERLKDVIGSAEGIKAEIDEVCDQLNDAAGQEARKLLAELKSALSNQKAEKSDQLGHEALTQTGTEAWFDFIAHAKKFSELEKSEFPANDDPCLLCHRPLDEPSASLIRRFWGLLNSETRAVASQANSAVSSASEQLKSIDVKFAAEGSAVREKISSHSTDLIMWIDTASNALEERKRAFVDGLEAGDVDKIPAASIEIGFDQLETIVAGLQRKVAELEAGDTLRTLETLKEERICLRHKQILKTNIDAIIAHVETQKWVQLANDARKQLNSRAFTAKSTQLFRLLIEGRYQTLLSEECGALKCALPFTPKLSGKAGKTHKQLKVDSGHKTVEVFSEGEQRALALADFLTEVNLNPMASGIILDDPVTSMDHERKGLIAKRLASEAKKRQVIVFTHDLVFLTELLDAAENNGSEPVTHWVQSHGTSPGIVSFNDSPATRRAYRKPTIAENRLTEAKKLTGQDQVDMLKSGAGALRKTLEIVVTSRLLQGVVERWKEPISVMKLASINWRQEVVDEIISLFEDISRFIEGHDNTDEFAGGMPTPDDLEDLIVRVRQVIKDSAPKQG